MFRTFSTDTLSPHYDPDDGPITVSAAYRAEVRAFLLGEPEPPVPPPPVQPPLPESCPAFTAPPPPSPTRPVPGSWYTLPDEFRDKFPCGLHDYAPSEFPAIIFDFRSPHIFDPNPVLAGFAYHACDFDDLRLTDIPAPDRVWIVLVDSKGAYTGNYVPIDRLPADHIALIDSARIAWNAKRADQQARANSPSPLTARGSGGEVLPAAVTPSYPSDNAPFPLTERGSGGEVLSDLAPYLSNLLTAHPHLLDALAALRAARSERARRATLTRRAHRHFPVGTPFLASALWPASAYPVTSTTPPVSACPTQSRPNPIRPRLSSNSDFRHNNLTHPFIKWIAHLSAVWPPKWTIPIPPRARPPPPLINVLAVPPGVFAFGTPSQLNSRGDPSGLPFPPACVGDKGPGVEGFSSGLPFPPACVGDKGPGDRGAPGGRAMGLYCGARAFQDPLCRFSACAWRMCR